MKKTSNVKNVVIVNDFDYVQGGASKVAIDTANLLIENNENINVYFFSGVHDSNSILNKKIINVCTEQMESLKDKNRIRGFFNGLYNFRAKKKFKKLLESLNNNETVIHVHGWTKCLSSSIFDVAFKMKFNMVFTLHDYFTACPNGGYFNYPQCKICHLNPLSFKCVKSNCDSRNYIFKLYRLLRQFIQNKIVRLNDKLTDVITISEFSENILKKTLNKNVNLHRVYNPIEFEGNCKKNVISSEPYFLYVGRLSKEKGVDIFCESIARDKLRGIVVGDGEQKKSLQEKYPMIDFVGWKNKDEVNEYMRKAKAVIMPSRWYEGAPLTPLEAISNGTKCYVSTRCSAVDYIDKEIGILGFDIDNLDILNLENDKTIINEKKVAEYLRKFNVDEYNKNILNVYKKISEKKK